MTAAPDAAEPGPTPAGPQSRVVARFEIARRGFLDKDGRPLGPLPPLGEDREGLVAMYRAMHMTRQFDARAVSLQRTGQLGTFPSSLGQEAASVGIGAAMKPEDVLFATYREQGTFLRRGVTLVELFQMWSGDERGYDWKGPRADFPPSIPIASHVPHAAGAAFAFQRRGEKRVAVCVLGDGATSKGDFYEAINVAGVWKLPAVFVVVNNGWAISVPRAAQSAAETLAQKAIAAGIPGEQADGNDIIAVRHVVGEAVEAARAGGGPRLIELLTYRLSDHTTADDATRYRTEAEVSAHWALDPLVRLRSFLGARGWWTKDDEEALINAVKAEIDAARDAYLALPPPRPTDMFDHLYATLPAAYADQRARLAEDADG
ncbi:MAG: pyruvate dehydrogenase (acetyl-transferring) E1 component subunit alpha [Rhodospirillales bacterium]